MLPGLLGVDELMDQTITIWGRKSHMESRKFENSVFRSLLDDPCLLDIILFSHLFNDLLNSLSHHISEMMNSKHKYMSQRVHLDVIDRKHAKFINIPR